MPQLDEHARAHLDAYAATMQPSSQGRRRNRAQVLERIAAHDDPPEAGPDPTHRGPIRMRWPVVTLAVAATVVGAIAAGQALRTPQQVVEVDPTSQAEATVESAESSQAVTSTRSRSAPVPPSAPEARPRSMEPPPPDPEPPVSVPRRRAEPREAPQPNPATPQSSAPLAEPREQPRAPTRLAAEVRLISRARSEVTAGRDAAALALFRRHAREFPKGSLVEERTAWVAVLQCRLQRPGGRAEATKFLAAYPSSPHAARVRTICSTSVTDENPTRE